MLISSKTRRSPRGEDGPGNCTLLHRTAAEFTSKGIPDAFGVLCHLDAPCRPSIRFLSIGSRFGLRCAPSMKFGFAGFSVPLDAALSFY